MVQATQLKKARIIELEWYGDNNTQSREKSGGKSFDVQFNPESLKVAFTNQKAGGEQPGGSPIQFVGTGSTKLSLSLYFDVTVPVSENNKVVNDVRTLTADVAHFMKPGPAADGQENAFVPPGIRFSWGSFLFDGVMDSMDETLEYFSEDGRPLRASVSIALSRQEITIKRPAPVDATGNSPTGTEPYQAARSGDSLPKMAGRSGKQSDWKRIAAANNIENPRQIPAGTLINLGSAKR